MLKREYEKTHTHSVSVSASIGDDAAKASFSKEDQDFVKQASSFAESMEDSVESEETWKIYIDCATEQHLYRGKVTYTFADGTETTLSDRSYHIRNKAVPLNSLSGSVVPVLSNVSSFSV